MQVRAVEETADTVYLVLPSASPVGEGGELSDRELDTVAGGWGNPGTGFPTDALHPEATKGAYPHKALDETRRTPHASDAPLTPTRAPKEACRGGPCAATS